MLVEWPNLEEQWATTSRVRAELGALSWDERAAAVDPPGYRVAQQIARAVPPGGCVLVLAYTGPEHVGYYRARFQYYLYPRRVRFADRTDAPAGDCGHLAVFRDTPANLAQEPFRGHWDPGALTRRTAGLEKLFSGEQVEVFRGR